MKTVELLLNDYIGDNYNPSRQTKFTITEECLTHISIILLII